jgi:hypothetical protein
MSLYFIFIELPSLTGWKVHSAKKKNLLLARSQSLGLYSLSKQSPRSRAAQCASAGHYPCPVLTHSARARERARLDFGYKHQNLFLDRYYHSQPSVAQRMAWPPYLTTIFWEGWVPALRTTVRERLPLIR